MIKKRCGVNLGKEILTETKKILEVHNFWKKLSPLNNVIKRASKGEYQKHRVIIVESEALDGLNSWLRHNKIKALSSPTYEEMRNEIVSPSVCFFLFTPNEYAIRWEAEDFQKIIKRLPKPLDLSITSQDSKLNVNEVLSAFSEVNELPYCTREIIKIKESSTVNLIIFLVLLKNYIGFCCESIYCNKERIEKCKGCLSEFSLRLKKEFFDLIRSNGIYYPLSLYMGHQFPESCIYIDINSFLNGLDNPLELAIFLHDAYHMGEIIYPGFGITTAVENIPDAYLLDYVYPLEKSISPKQISSLIFLSALEKDGNQLKNFLYDVRDKIRTLPLGEEVGELISKSLAAMNKCYELWYFSKDVVLKLYAIWKLKKMLESSYAKTKVDLSKLNSSRVKVIVERINSLLYDCKDFLEYDLAIELGINLNLVKEFFKNINEIVKEENEVDVLEQLLLLYHDVLCKKLRDATISYTTKKIAASQIWEDILSSLNKMKMMDDNEILEFLPFVATLFDYPIFTIEEKIIFLQMLRNKECDQSGEVIDFIKKAVIDEIVLRPTLSIEIDKLVNQWKTGNPLNFFMNGIVEKIAQDQFDPNLFKEAFKTFCSINVLKLFRREPSRFFNYQSILDKYVGLQINKSGKQYFDYFDPITSVFETIRKLQEQDKKVVLLIFDGLGFIHSYFACLEISRKESTKLAEFCEGIVDVFRKGNAKILSSLIPTVTGVNHIALFFGEKLLYDDSFLIRASDNSFMPNKGEDKARVFSILDLSEQDRKSAILRLRLEECSLQRPTSLWDVVLGQTQKRGLLVSANSERTFLSYLFKGNAAFKQVDSYTSAIDEALSDKTHDLVVSQVNLLDAFLQALNTRYPPALFNDVVKGYWEVYLDLWKNVINRIFDGFEKMKKGTVVIITADHGLALGRTSEFKEIKQVLGSVKGARCLPRHRISEIVSEDNRLIGACIPGHTSRKFMSIFLLKSGLNKRENIEEVLELAKQTNEIVFEKIMIEENKRNLTIKPDFLVFPTIGMFARPDKKKYFGGIHGGISMCELFIPLIQLEK
jgi:hypothetical protein